MKVTMRTTAAGPNGQMFPDKTYDIPSDQAKALIDGGYAVSAEPKAPAIPVQVAKEGATRTPPARKSFTPAASNDDK